MTTSDAGWRGGNRFGYRPVVDRDGTPAVPAWGRGWVTGLCFDFALALLERLPDGEIVGFGQSLFPDHVGVRHGGMILDIRGELDESGFGASHPGLAIIPIARETVELHAGVATTPPPYTGVTEMEEARRAVARRFPGLPPAEPPPPSRRPR